MHRCEARQAQVQQDERVRVKRVLTTALLDDVDGDPSTEEEQRAGRALLWDKRLDLTTQAENEDSGIAQQPYVYQTRTP